MKTQILLLRLHSNPSFTLIFCVCSLLLYWHPFHSISSDAKRSAPANAKWNREVFRARERGGERVADAYTHHEKRVFVVLFRICFVIEMCLDSAQPWCGQTTPIDLHFISTMKNKTFFAAYHWDTAEWSERQVNYGRTHRSRAEKSAYIPNRSDETRMEEKGHIVYGFGWNARTRGNVIVNS